jgi:hypothetical protein
VNKCTFAAQQVSYLGHTLMSKGIKPGIDKVRAIKEAQVPDTPAAIRSFMGLANYFRNYISCFSLLAVPLFKLTRSTIEWKGGHPTQSLQALNNIPTYLVGGNSPYSPTLSGWASFTSMWTRRPAPSPLTGPRGDWAPC